MMCERKHMLDKSLGQLEFFKILNIIKLNTN